uniref:Immunoglobulin domain-containing protein n=1 Tax=Xiphophorus maculatus TaxID=8083 RepID=A0A3B5QNC3_XIPMA
LTTNHMTFISLVLINKTTKTSDDRLYAVLTIDPNWSTFHSGDRVTFICDINEGKDTDWEYEIKKNGEQFLRSNPYKSFTFLPIQIDHSGEYQCCGLRKSSGDTKCSDTVSLTVTGESKWIFNLTALGTATDTPHYFTVRNNTGQFCCHVFIICCDDYCISAALRCQR